MKYNVEMQKEGIRRFRIEYNGHKLVFIEHLEPSTYRAVGSSLSLNKGVDFFFIIAIGQQPFS